MRLGIAGLHGRVGRLLVEEASRAGALLVGGTSRRGSAAGPHPAEVALFPSLAALAAETDVIIDFTHPDATAGHAAVLAEAGVAWVLGTTGLCSVAQKAVAAAAARIAVVQAANFSPGVALVLDLAARLGAALPAPDYDAEILEMHHRHKTDAPSGTALALGRAVAQGRGVDRPEQESGRHGRSGPRREGAIGYAALRAGEIVGEHTLLFTSGGEQISLTHRAFDRRLFAAGALRAAAWTQGRAPGLYGMPDVLGLGLV